MAEFASNAKANTGLALSGTSLGFSLLGGGLSWLLGGNRMMNGGCCNEDHLINRYELQKEHYEEEINKVAGHRVLALNRGEKEKFLVYIQLIQIHGVL